MIKNFLLSSFFCLTTIHADYTLNQAGVLFQLQNCENPSEKLRHIKNEIDCLEPKPFHHALNQLSGEQFTSLAVANEVASTNILRSLYTPLRLQVVIPPCSYTCCDAPDIEMWIQGGGRQSFINNCRHAKNSIANSYSLSLGAHTKLKCNWTIGTAAFFADRRMNSHIDGKGKDHMGFAGLYGLYRPIGYYVMGDLIYGASKGSFKRAVAINQTHYHCFSRPNFDQILGYIEAGLDHYLCHFLVQPFFGLEGHAFLRGRIVERGNSLFNLQISRRSDGNIFSRLGAHVTSNQCRFLVSLDLVWKYQLNPSHHKMIARFQHFGRKFCIKDVKRGRSFFEYALALSTICPKGLNFFTEVAGLVGYHSSSYQVLAGLQSHW